MSVLNATGGKSPSLINDCNTITQVKSIEQQLNKGIRMFDIRTDVYKGVAYTKHAPADCMDDALAGGYGEALDTVLAGVSRFIKANPGEFVILSFCHLCSKQVTLAQQAASIVQKLGMAIVFDAQGKQIQDILLKSLQGKVLVTFEGAGFPEYKVWNNAMADTATVFMNYKRAYAATNNLEKMRQKQAFFFSNMKPRPNDIVRLDWQLTEGNTEAPFICNEFQSHKSNPLVDGVMLLANSLQRSKSILDLALLANKSLAWQLTKWVSNGTVSKRNKPNIIYVDAAGAWVTNFCVGLNQQALYQQ
jgi:hypothetical protein